MCSCKMSAFSTQTQMETNNQGTDTAVDQFHKVLETQKEILILKIDPSHGLWAALSDRKVLPDRTINSCKAEKTDEDRIERLLEYLKKHVIEKAKVCLFYEALKSSGQKHIVDVYFQPAGDICLR